MSRKNRPEAKAERRFWNKLNEATVKWNRPMFKEIDGKLYKGVRPYRDLVAEYKQGLLYIKVVKKDLEIMPSIYKLMEAIENTPGSKILINTKKNEPTTLDSIGANQTYPRRDNIDRDNHPRGRDHAQGGQIRNSPQR